MRRADLEGNRTLRGSLLGFRSPSLELWRAGRLVVDTGIHSKRWTRNHAIEYLIKNTPNTEADCTDSINRYIVMPSQATAYKVGMLKILELREKAKKSLGENSISPNSMKWF